MAFSVSLEKFSGPLDLLLEIVEQEKLPITEVSLAQVTETYLKYLEALDVPADELADFLVVATRLLLLKSRAILPNPPEEENEVSTLALQLKMYKEFVELSKNLELLFEKNELFARGKQDVYKSEKFILSENVSLQSLKDSFAYVLRRLQPFFDMTRTTMERVVSVKERLEEIRTTIMNRAKFTFGDVILKAGSKVDVVVSFLALLELVKQRSVSVIQKGTFNDIEIKRVD